MPRHRLYIDDPGALVEGDVVIGGEEARHAIRVKRLGRGEAVEILDGAGRVGAGTLADTTRDGAEWRAVVSVRSVRSEAPQRPRVVVCAAPPQGSRLDVMIDGLSQTGAAEWRALRTGRAAPDSEAGGRRSERMERIAAEASKQCGRAWLLEIGEPVALGAALRGVAGEGVVMAHADGEPYVRIGAGMIRLLIGPEGGWEGSELDAARAVGVRIVRFGPHTMRVETAAVVASGIVLHAENQP